MVELVYLKQVQIFENIDEGALGLLVDLCERRKFEAGAVLFRTEEVADELYILLSGRVALTMPISVFMVEREMQIESQGPGEPLGWSALVPPHRYTLTASMTEPGEVLVVGREALLKICQDRPEVGFTMMSNVARVIGERLVQFKTLLIKEVERSIRLV